MTGYAEQHYYAIRTGTPRRLVDVTAQETNRRVNPEYGFVRSQRLLADHDGQTDTLGVIYILRPNSDLSVCLTNFTGNFFASSTAFRF